MPNSFCPANRAAIDAADKALAAVDRALATATSPKAGYAAMTALLQALSSAGVARKALDALAASEQRDGDHIVRIEQARLQAQQQCELARTQAVQRCAIADQDARDKISSISGSGIYALRRLCDFAVRRDGSLGFSGLVIAYVVAFVLLWFAGISQDRRFLLAFCAPLLVYALARFADEKIGWSTGRALAEADGQKQDIENLRRQAEAAAKANESALVAAAQKILNDRLANLAAILKRIDAALEAKAKQAAMAMDTWKSRLEADLGKTVSAQGGNAPPTYLLLGRLVVSG